MSTTGPPEEAARESHTVGKVSRSAFWVFASAVATLAIGFVTSLIAARVLGPSDQGIYSALLVDATVLSDLLALGIPATVLYLASRSREDRPGLLGMVFVQTALIGLVTIALAVLVGPWLAERQGAHGRGELYVLAAIVAPAGFIDAACMNLLRARLRFQMANVLSIAGRLTVLVLILVLVVGLHLGVTGAIIAVIGCSVLEVVACLPVITRDGVTVSRELTRRSLHYGVRSQVGQVSRFASGRFDILLLSFLAPSAVVGYYAIAQIVAELVLIVPRAFGTILTPVMAARDGPHELTGQMLRLNGTISLAMALGSAVFGPLLVVYGYGSAYDQAITPLLVLLPGIWMLCVGNLVLFVLAARNRPGTASWLAIMQAVVTVGLDFLLIPPLEATGAALASAISYSIFGVVCLVLIGRHDRAAPWRLLFVTPAEARAYVPAVRERIRGLLPWRGRSA